MIAETNKKVFLFDLDRTLLDTDLLKNSFVAEIQKVLDKSKVNHITAKELLSQYQNEHSKMPSETSYAQFESKEFLNFIAEKINLDEKLRNKIELADLRGHFYNPEIYKEAVFTETTDVLQEIKNKYPHAILGIFSEGTEWQKRKIKLAELSQYLTTNENYLLISENKLSDAFHKRLANMPAKTIIVDDRLDILEKVATKHNHLTLVHIDRNSVNKDTINNTSIITINNLRDLLELEQLNH